MRYQTLFIIFILSMVEKVRSSIIFTELNRINCKDGCAKTEYSYYFYFLVPSMFSFYTFGRITTATIMQVFNTRKKSVQKIKPTIKYVQTFLFIHINCFTNIFECLVESSALDKIHFCCNYWLLCVR